MLRKGRRIVKNWKWAVILLLVMALCAAGGYFILTGNQDADTAQILSDGQILRTVSLNVNQKFTIEAANGGYNTVTVQDGKIAVTEASCPDHYCMHRGFCSGGTDIVCLPNKLVIQFVKQQEIDAAVG